MDSLPTTNKTGSFPQLDEIIGLIDQGASLFWAKEYKEACFTLTRALEINKEMLFSEMLYDFDQSKDSTDEFVNEESLNPPPCASSSAPGGRSLSTISSPSSYCSCLKLMNFVIARSINWGSLLCDERNEDMYSWSVDQDRRKYYAYPTLLVVQSSEQLRELFGNVSNQDTHLAFSLIIIFNLALSHHFHALDQIKNGCPFSTRCILLDRAFLLYKHSEVLLHELHLQSCWFLNLVISNNEAQLLLMMDKHQEASSLLHLILSCLCCLNLYNRDGLEELAPVAAFEAFVHNTSYTILKDIITAAAA